MSEANDELLAAAKMAAKIILSHYEWLGMVEAAGGAKSISGIAKCHAMLMSLRKNEARTEQLVMKPLREAIAKVEGRS